MQPLMNIVFLVTLTHLYGDGECSWRQRGTGFDYSPYENPFGTPKYPDYLNTAQSQDFSDFGLPPGPPNFGPPGYLPTFHSRDITWPWDVPLEGPLNKVKYPITINPRLQDNSPTIQNPKLPFETKPIVSPPTWTSPSAIGPTQSPAVISPVEVCLRTCPVTSEYNPVCGTNDITYQNPGRLLCARQCGVDVQIKRATDCSVPVGGPIQTAGPSIGKGLTASPAAVALCLTTCQMSPDLKPVCGTNYVTYFNIDRLQCAQKCGEAVDLLCASACDTYDCGASLSTTVKSPTELLKAFEECKLSCSVTTEDNPVCGSNNVTYDNPSALLCSQYCGVDVKVISFSSCSTNAGSHNTHQPTKEKCSNACRLTSKDYNPVCGSNNITYSNIEELECAKNCGIKVELKRNGPCQLIIVDTPSSTTTSYSTTPGVSEVTIPQHILNEIFGIDQSTTPYTPTTESDENFVLDVRFGDSTETQTETNNKNSIVFSD